MRKIPIALGVIIGGLMAVIFGAANNWGWVISAGGVAIIGGWVWFSKGWAELMSWMLPVKSYTNRMRKMEKEARIREQEQAALNSSFNKRIRSLNKRRERNVKGFLYHDGKIVEMVQIEETA